MKKLYVIILAFVLVFSLVACGSSSKVPDGFDQALYDYATAAYELVHDYNLGKVDKDAAAQRADTISKNIDALPVPKNNTKWSDSTFQSTYNINKLSITTSLGTFVMKLSTGSSTVDVENSLKKLIEK